MDKNIRIAKQLVKLAKVLVSAENVLFEIPVYPCDKVDFDDVSWKYDSEHKFMAFLPGTWSGLEIDFIPNTFGSTTMTVSNAKSKFHKHYLSQRLADLLKYHLKGKVEVRCMQ